MNPNAIYNLMIYLRFGRQDAWKLPTWILTKIDLIITRLKI